MNSTIEKFDYPASLLCEYEHWVVLLRPKQVTLGSMIVACKEDVKELPSISSAAFLELKKVTFDLENTLRAEWNFERINYIMLMMVDPHVHFHVIPRYANERVFKDVPFRDAGWPKHPDMLATHEISPELMRELTEHLKSNWQSK